VVVANGNSGNEGAFTVSDPAGAHDVLSIGSASNDHFLGSVFYIQSSKSDKNVGPYCKCQS
jgi:hypothetical protein